MSTRFGASSFRLVRGLRVSPYTRTATRIPVTANKVSIQSIAGTDRGKASSTCIAIARNAANANATVDTLTATQIVSRSLSAT